MNKTNKYIVLDIDATLVHTHDIDDEGVKPSEKFEELNIYSDDDRIKLRKNLYLMKLIDINKSGKGEVTVLSGMYRPYLRHFLDFCKNYFEGIIIWSAGQKKYVEKMVEIMFPFKDYQPMIIYTYNDCIITYDENDDVNVKKPLTKLFKEKKLKNKLNEKNTFVLDDREDTFSANEKNGIQIPVFETDLTIEEIAKHGDINLIKLMAWFETKEVKNCSDITKLKKDKIFEKKLDDYNKQLKKEIK